MPETLANNTEETVQKSMAFWKRKNARPLLALRVGSDCAFNLFETAADLRHRKDIQPDDIVPEKFLRDYERFARESEQIRQDTSFALEPFFGIPWMNMICGCKIESSVDSSWVHPPDVSPQDWLRIPIDLEENAWFLKLLEFTDLLTEFSGGRYPVTQPLLRGPSDLLGSIMGEENAVVGLTTGSNLCLDILERCTDLYIEVLNELHKRHKPFCGGWLLGYYRLWTPEPSCRLQEDVTTLYSPGLYDSCVRGLDEQIFDQWKYNVLHLHSPQTFLLEKVLSIPSLKCVEFDVDFEEQAEQLLPHFEKVQKAGKCLILDGYLGWNTVEMLTEQLNPEGLCFHIKKHTLSEAQDFSRMFYGRFANQEIGKSSNKDLGSQK